MNLLSGSFGLGSVSYHQSTLSVHPNGLFSKSESISIADVVDVHQVGADASKKIGETAALGGMGLVLGSVLGPVGALAGLAAGAMAGGKANHVTFVCRLQDGRSFVAKASAQDFGEFWADYQSNVSQLSTPNTAVALGKSQRRARRGTHAKESKNARSSRENANAPEPNCSLLLVLKGEVAANKIAPHGAALTDLLAYSMVFNQVKWRFFRQELDNRDFIRLAALHIISLERRAKISEGQDDVTRRGIAEHRKNFDILKMEFDAIPEAAPRKLWNARTAELRRQEKIETIQQEMDSEQRWLEQHQTWEPRAPKYHAEARFLVDRYSEHLPVAELDELRARCCNIVTTSEKWQLNTTFAVSQLRDIHPGIRNESADDQIERSEAAVTPATKSPKDRLTELKSLLEEGFINQEEYQDRRKAILRGI